jgi:hypothetical protein
MPEYIIDPSFICTNMQCGHFPFTLVEILDSAAYDDEIASLGKKFEIEMVGR